MKKRNMMLATVLLGHLFFRMAILLSSFLIVDFEFLLNSVLMEKPAYIGIVQLLFLGLGFWIASRYGRDESWTKLFIGYVTGIMASFLLLSVLVIGLKISIPYGVLVFFPYVCILIFTLWFTLHLSDEKATRFYPIGFFGTVLIIVYEGFATFLPESVLVYLQFIVFLPLLLLGFKPKKTTI